LLAAVVAVIAFTGALGDGTWWAIAAAWAAFHPGWQAWNHVRTVACAASCVGFVLALLVA